MYPSLKEEYDYENIRDWNIPTPYPHGYLEKLYDYVIQHKPKTIVEFGSGWGSTTIYMRKAQETYGGELYSRELDTEKYDGARKNFSDYNILDTIYYYNESYDVYFDDPFEFDLLYIDVHNEGFRVNKILQNEFIQKMIKEKKHILFEGGSDERNNIATSRGGSSFKIIEHDYELIYGNQNDRHTLSRLC